MITSSIGQLPRSIYVHHQPSGSKATMHIVLCIIISLSFLPIPLSSNQLDRGALVVPEPDPVALQPIPVRAGAAQSITKQSLPPWTAASRRKTRRDRRSGATDVATAPRTSLAPFNRWPSSGAGRRHCGGKKSEKNNSAEDRMPDKKELQGAVVTLIEYRLFVDAEQPMLGR